MHTQPEFLRGSIAQDFQGILDSDANPEIASLDLAAKKKKPPKSHGPCGTEPTQTPDCTKKDPCAPKKKAAFLPDVPGWSMPPAPPAI
jgi:hypothetical protein